MSLSDLAIRRPLLSWMVFVAIVIFGSVSFLRLGISELPDVDYPVITLRLTNGGKDTHAGHDVDQLRRIGREVNEIVGPFVQAPDHLGPVIRVGQDHRPERNGPSAHECGCGRSRHVCEPARRSLDHSTGSSTETESCHIETMKGLLRRK